jgi:chemosensory pili system protein ChpA (sensor histidine kinase/response regulator)
VQFPGIRGAAVLGNGEAVPVVNLAALSAVGSRKTMPPLPTSEAGINILVVDDSPSVRHLTSKLIEREGWSCSTAKNGAEALEMLRSAATLPQIVLTDIEMPRMDGYQLAEALSRDERLGLLPVVFITSRTNEKHRRRAAEIGITEYLTKPFDAAALRTIVNKLISVT